MKKFFEMLTKMDAENCAATLKKLQAGKNPVAFLSVENFADATETVKNFRTQGLNIITLISNQVPKDFKADFAAVSLQEVNKLQPQPEYIFTETNLSARVATKILPRGKVITLQNKNLRELEDNYKKFVGNLTQFEELYNALADDESKKTFRGYFLSNALNQIGAANFSIIPHYLTKNFTPQAENIVVNFEVDKIDGWKKFTKLGCKVYNFGTSGKAENLTAETFGLDGYVHKGFTMLDEYVRDKKIPRVDFLNVNVLGNERNIIRGAAEIILRFKPTIALTMHGKLLELPELLRIIKSIRSDYEFAFRQCVITPKDEPEKFQADVPGGLEKILLGLGLELDVRNFDEVTLLAR